MTDRLKPEKLSQLSVAGIGRHDGRRFAPLSFGARFRLFLLLTIIFALIAAACTTDRERRSVRPRQLRDVPANILAYRFEGDVDPPKNITDDPVDKLTPIQDDFNNRRTEDALLRTVVSPDGQRALALYGTAEEPSENFRIDLYSTDGNFLRNLTPPDLAASFAEAVVWSSDSNLIAFIGRRSLKPTPTPTPAEPVVEIPEGSPQPSATIAPSFAPVPLFNSEQIYLCNRDGFDLHPLTTREGLIYFYIAWAPDNHALVALACRESEWEARAGDYKLPAGRPRLISLDGKERLLDDDLAEAAPAWSPDSSKVATAFDTDVGIYDAVGKTPTQARIKLREPLIKASVAFEEKKAGATNQANNANVSSTPAESAAPSGRIPVSFNPIVRVEWPAADQLFVQTAFVRMFPNDPVNNFPRWHLLALSPQAAILK